MTQEEMLTELTTIAAEHDQLVRELAKVDARRDQLVRELMRSDVNRGRVEKASGLKIARLYQIRDGRR
jgi:hypothetical protein